jgi:hypothetical protein
MRSTPDAKRKTSVRKQATDGGSGLAALFAVVSIFGVSVGDAHTATLAPAAPLTSADPRVGGAKPAKHDVELASALLKLSTPQVHVNIRTRVNTGNAHPAGANSNAFRIGIVRQVGNNNGAKDTSRGAAGNSGPKRHLRQPRIDTDSAIGEPAPLLGTNISQRPAWEQSSWKRPCASGADQSSFMAHRCEAGASKP